MKKSTHEAYKTELFMPVMKGKEGKYMAVLSDNSTDRDDESVSKSCIQKLGSDDGYLVALCNHKNDVFMQVAEWTNKGCKEIDGHTALIAEPKFYMSNPNAKIIKGMLDEGAKMGISIGAMVKNYDEVDGKKQFTDLELLEASFVAIPSNRHGRAMRVAKSFEVKMEEIKVEKQYTEKDLNLALEKKQDEFKKQLEEKDLELTKIKEEMTTKEAEAEAKVAEAEEKVKEAEEKVEAEKSKAIEKQQFAVQTSTEKVLEDDVNKSIADGKLPILRL